MVVQMTVICNWTLTLASFRLEILCWGSLTTLRPSLIMMSSSPPTEDGTHTTTTSASTHSLLERSFMLSFLYDIISCSTGTWDVLAWIQSYPNPIPMLLLKDLGMRSDTCMHTHVPTCITKNLCICISFFLLEGQGNGEKRVHVASAALA